MGVKAVGQLFFLVILTVAGILWTLSRWERHSELSTSKYSLTQVKPKHLFKKSGIVSKHRGHLAEDLDSTLCTNVEQDIKFAPKDSMPLVALASFPRSGNTWTRYMLQIATQIYTTSVYRKYEVQMDSSKALKGCQIDYKDGRGIVVKSHLYEESHVRSFEGAILLIRNPFESSVSEFFRVHTFVRNKTNAEVRHLIESRAEVWIKSTKESFKYWHDLNLSWIKNSKRLLIVYYRNLIEHTEREITRMIMFLGQPIKPHLISCAIKTYPWRDRNHLTSKPFFLPSLVKHILDVNKTLIERKVRPLPSHWV